MCHVHEHVQWQHGNLLQLLLHQQPKPLACQLHSLFVQMLRTRQQGLRQLQHVAHICRLQVCHDGVLDQLQE